MKPVTSKRPRVPEKSIEAGIIAMLQLAGWQVHKIDVLKGRKITYTHKGKESHRMFQDPTAVKGQPDLVAIKVLAPCNPTSKHYVVYIETKASDGVLSVEQHASHAVLRKAGYTVLVPRSIQDFQRQMWDLGLGERLGEPK